MDAMKVFSSGRSDIRTKRSYHATMDFYWYVQLGMRSAVLRNVRHEGEPISMQISFKPSLFGTPEETKS